MKITEINESVMKGLKRGDVVHTDSGASLKIKGAVLSGSFNYPHQLTFEKYPNAYSFTSAGKMYATGQTHFLDIIAVEKAVVIPEGFIKWEGQRYSGHVKLLTEDGKIHKANVDAPISSINNSVVIAYRPVAPPQQGEIWAVVRCDAMGISNVGFFETQTIAINHAKFDNETVLAIFNPFKTGGVWKEGDGLKLLGGGDEREMSVLRS